MLNRISVLFIALFFIFIPNNQSIAAEFKVSDSTDIRLDALLRGYYLNDQRIEWSGLESTFGVEAIISPWIEKKYNWGEIKVGGEFLLNQPFGENILMDIEGRREYRSNFETETFETSELNIQVKRGSLIFKIGKAETPFGRTYFQAFSNSRFDAPFIRTEAILWKETGIFLQYKPKFFVLDLAIVNGEEEKDTNSSKAGIARLGAEGENWAFGISAKYQDGIGSGVQKTFKNHAGADFMIRYSSFTFSGEFIYDEYGLYRDYEDDIFWPRSLYYRDIYYRDETPVTGIGGYLNLGYRKANWIVDLNYGEYYPKEIGNPYHDDPIRRGLAKLAYNFTAELQAFGVVLIENKRETEEWKSDARPFAVLIGLQYKL